MSTKQTTKRLMLVLAVLGTLVLAAPVVSALDTYIRIVQITYNSGDVLAAKSASDSPAPVSDFQPLNHDSYLVTEDGIVEIEFENEIVARMAEDSRLHLAELLHRDDGSRFTQLSLQSGTATFISKLRDGDEFIVSTPFFTVVSERKARFRIDLGEQGGRVQVTKGKVEVQTPTEVLQLSKGRQLEWDSANSQIALAEIGAADGWDEWNQDRDDSIQAARNRQRWSTRASSVGYGSYYGDSHYGHNHRWGYCPYSYGSYGYGYGYYPSSYYSYYHTHWGLFGFGHHYYPRYSVYYSSYSWPYFSINFGHHRYRSSHRRRHRDRDRDRHRDGYRDRDRDHDDSYTATAVAKSDTYSPDPTVTDDSRSKPRSGRRSDGYSNRRSAWTGSRRGGSPTAESLNWTAVSTTRKGRAGRARETFERDTPGSGSSSASSTVASATPVRVDRTKRRKSSTRVNSRSEGYTRERTANTRTTGRSAERKRSSESRSSSARRSADSSSRDEARSRSRSSQASKSSNSSSRGNEARSSSRSSRPSRSASSSSSSRGSRGSASSSRSRGSSSSSARRAPSRSSSSSKPKASKRSSRSSSSGSRSRSRSSSSRSSGSSSKSKSKKN